MVYRRLGFTGGRRGRRDAAGGHASRGRRGSGGADLVESARTAMLRAGQGGFAGSHEAPYPPGPRFGLSKRAVDVVAGGRPTWLQALEPSCCGWLIGKCPCLFRKRPCFIGKWKCLVGECLCLIGKSLSERFMVSASTKMLRVAQGGHAPSNLPGLRSGLRRGAPSLREGRGGRRRGVLTEARRHFQPAGGPPRSLERERSSSRRGGPRSRSSCL